MKSVIKFFVQHHIVGDILMIAILISGLVGMTNMKSNFFPVVKSKFINIQVVYQGLRQRKLRLELSQRLKKIYKDLRILIWSHQHVLRMRHQLEYLFQILIKQMRFFRM